MTCRVGSGRLATPGQLAARIPWDSLQSILVPSVVKTTPRSCKNLRHCASSVKPNSDSTKEAGIEGRYLQHTQHNSRWRRNTGAGAERKQNNKLAHCHNKLYPSCSHISFYHFKLHSFSHPYKAG
ncbi:hypothetical protein OS493_026759 [Desmophyllum pertusum]|uniref:Uncharacterized protein n=1 Tax=Desmophyllum pertusum TaxID=174260 RepID=A0A9W9ZYJ1_9CNID|nr:hypothetical protein OS493_026759 [Desmophyllum pertusum]